MLTTAQFAEKIGVTPGRVRQLLSNGTIRGTAITSRLTLIDEGELAKARARKKEPGRAAQPPASANKRRQ